MNKYNTNKHVTKLIATALCAAPLLANAGESTDKLVIPAPTQKNAWEFRITPYAWLTALDGTTGPDGYTADVDASFDDITKNLKMAAALQMEARNGKWGFLVDGFYADLGQSGTAAGPLKEDVDLDLKQFIGEFDILYRVSESTNSFLDVYAGVRYNQMDLDLEISGIRNRSISESKDWADPIIGLRGQWDINEKWYLSGKGDIGGFGVSSQFTWNLQAAVGYSFNECVSTELGYRYFDTDYNDQGFTYDIAQSGLVLGLNFEF